MKKLLSLAMATVLAFSVVACGGSKAPADTEETTTGEAAETTEGTETDSEGAEDAESTGAAAEGGVLKIGGIGPITGGAAVYGMAVMNAANLAVDEINAAGGINGRNL